MSDWQSAIDKLLREAQESPEWKNLPGEGRPLDLEDNPYAPADQKMAFKLLKDNDLAPSWIMDGKALDAKRDQLLKRITNVKASTTGSASQSLRDAVKDFNNEILSYNLKVPSGVPHKRFLDLDRLLAR